MDKFDDIWKNRFNDSKVPVGDWNTPDDDLVWEGIAPHIPQRDDRQKFIWFWWGLGLLFLFLLGWLVINQAQATTAQSENVIEEKLSDIDNLSISLEKAEENLATSAIAATTDENLKTTNNAPEKSIISQKTVSQRKKKNTRHRNKKIASPIVKNPKEQSNLSSVETNASTNIENVEFSFENDNETMLLDDVFSKIAAIENLPLKELAQKNTLSNMLNLKPVEDEDDKNASKILVAATTGLVYWQHDISNQYTSDLSPFDFNYQDNWGWQASVLTAFDLNEHLSPFVGFQYESVEVTSGHNSAITYESANEQGTNTNTYTQNLATPYGLTEATFRLNRNEILMEESVDLTVDFASTHQIQNWSMPVGLNYFPFGKKRKFQLNISAGLAVNYIVGIDNQLKDVDTHHALIQYAVDSPTIFESPMIEQWHFDLRMGTGLNYNIKRNLKVNFNYNFSRGLNSVFQQDDYTTKINRHQLSIGLVKTLNFR